MKSAGFHAQALEQLRAHKKLAERQAEERYQSALHSSPALEEIGLALSRISTQAVQASLAGETERVLSLRQTSRKLREQFDALLAENGLSRQDFLPVYDCPVCKDTGYFDGTPCACLRRLERRLSSEALSDHSPLKDCTFDNFDLSYYPAECREKMQSIFDFCRRYAHSCERGSEGILMLGGTGLGKTHLSLAIANEVLRRGMNVVYGSAASLLSKINREHFSPDAGKSLEALLDCDLLILDDLGTEVSSALTSSALYTILNDRLLAGRPTVVSTNCTLEELRKRYDDRILSRLAGNYRMLSFVGNDVRILKRSQSLQ